MYKFGHFEGFFEILNFQFKNSYLSDYHQYKLAVKPRVLNINKIMKS